MDDLEELDAKVELAAHTMWALLNDYTREWYGEPCPDYEPECACCRAWKFVHDFAEFNCDPTTKPVNKD